MVLRLVLWSRHRAIRPLPGFAPGRVEPMIDLASKFAPPHVSFRLCIAQWSAYQRHGCGLCRVVCRVVNMT
jgi:hypothetical protein